MRSSRPARHHHRRAARTATQRGHGRWQQVRVTGWLVPARCNDRCSINPALIFGVARCGGFPSPCYSNRILSTRCTRSALRDICARGGKLLTYLQISHNTPYTSVLVPRKRWQTEGEDEEEGESLASSRRHERDTPQNLRPEHARPQILRRLIRPIAVDPTHLTCLRCASRNATYHWLNVERDQYGGRTRWNR